MVAIGTAAVLVFCGILTYGLAKGICCSNCKNLGDRYSGSNEFWCWLLVLSNSLLFLGLIIALDIRLKASFVGDRWFCFRIPKEYKESKA